MNRSEKYIIIIMLVFAAVMYTYYYFQKRSINDNPVYVIGHLTKARDGGSETGWLFDFVYLYNNQRFSTTVNGPIGASTVKDSLMYFRISADKPSLSEPVLQQWVPPCVAEKGQPLLGWKEVPYCK